MATVDASYSCTPSRVTPLSPVKPSGAPVLGYLVSPAHTTTSFFESFTATSTDATVKLHSSRRLPLSGHTCRAILVALAGPAQLLEQGWRLIAATSRLVLRRVPEIAQDLVSDGPSLTTTSTRGRTCLARQPACLASHWSSSSVFIWASLFALTISSTVKTHHNWLA